MKNLQMSLFVLSMGSLLLLVNARPPYIECQDSAECGSFACCVVGPKMYTLPKCMPYLTRGERCSDSNFMPSNKNITYPDNEKVVYTNVHQLECPCEPGLSCGNVGGGSVASVCFDPLLMDNLNSISNSVYDNYY